MDIQTLFKNGLDRVIPTLVSPPEGVHLNLGPGDKKQVLCGDKATGLVGVGGGKLSSHPEWKAPRALPFNTGSIAAIHCYQFIEHFNYGEIMQMMQDWQRVLMPGGVVYIVTPHALSSMSWQALDHKTHWNEEVWDWLFNNEYYSTAGTVLEWKLRVHTCFLMGLVYRNLNVFTQLVKEDH